MGEFPCVEHLVDKACWFLSLSEGDLATLSLGKAARRWMNQETWQTTWSVSGRSCMKVKFVGLSVLF